MINLKRNISIKLRTCAPASMRWLFDDRATATTAVTAAAAATIAPNDVHI